MVTIIFGAGASFGSGPCTSANDLGFGDRLLTAPPLGKDLFSRLVALNGAFARLDPSLSALFKSDFEAGMSAVPRHSDLLGPLQKELACYLSSFQVQSANAYCRLVAKIGSLIGGVTFASLNYDILLEQALGFRVDYLEQSPGLSTVLKPHGSSNFLVEELGDFSGLVMSGEDGFGFLSGANQLFVGTHDEIVDWCRNPANGPITPIIALYDPNKRTLVNQEFLTAIHAKYEEVIAKSTHLVIIGVRLVEHDNHIWAPIAKSSAHVLVADPFPDSIAQWLESNRRVNPMTVVSGGFSDAVFKIAKFVRMAVLANT